MRQFSKPLVVVAEGEDPGPALTRATKIALENGTDLTLLMVAAPVPEETASLLPPAVLKELRAALGERRDARLHALASQIGAAGLSVRTVSQEGTPFLVTIREVLRSGHDLVLKTAGSDGEGELAFSSTDKHLLRKCPCAVWLLRSASSPTCRRILAAVDPDPKQPVQLDLSAAIVRAALGVAKMDAAELDVLHAWHVFGESILRGPETSIPDPEVDHIVGSALNRHVQYLDNLLDNASHQGVDLRRHLVRGMPGPVISAFAKSNGVDLLVMGTVGHTRIAGFLIGSTAERVIGEVKCSVLALKPKGFVSPVALTP